MTNCKFLNCPFYDEDIDGHCGAGIIDSCTWHKTATEFYGPLLTDCLEALDIGLNYVLESGWTRSRYKEAAIIQAAIDKAKEMLG